MIKRKTKKIITPIAPNSSHTCNAPLWGCSGREEIPIGLLVPAGISLEELNPNPNNGRWEISEETYSQIYKR